MKKRIHILAMLAVVLCSTSMFAASRPVTLPVGGNFTDASGGTGHFIGQFQLTQFADENNQLVAKGFLSGILTDSTGRVLGSVLKDVSIPVAVNNRLRSASTRLETSSNALAVEATCEILHLDLGPLSLNLLGLQVNLNEVVLDISAQSGSGNLLGNLLCAVTHLLDGAGSVADLANVLNQVLQAVTNILG